MSTTWAQSTSLSSAATAGTASPPIGLDPLAKMTAVQLTAGGAIATTGTGGTVLVQATLDGNGAWASGGAGGLQPSPQPLWGTVATLSSATQLAADNSYSFTLLQPVAGLRLLVGGIAVGTAVTMRALQSPSA